MNHPPLPTATESLRAALQRELAAATMRRLAGGQVASERLRQLVDLWRAGHRGAAPAWPTSPAQLCPADDTAWHPGAATTSPVCSEPAGLG